MTYLALDQALCNTGIAILDGKELLTTTFTTKSKNTTLVERLWALECILDLLCRKYKPDKVYMEEIFARNKTGATLSRVESIVQRYLHVSGIEYVSLSPIKSRANSWTGTLGLQGTKEFCKAWLDPYIGDPATTEHEIDAVGILWGGLVLDGIMSVQDIGSITFKRHNGKQFSTHVNQANS
jgi:Holliday junction resolvasome RuvABC endonuclease subunit